MDEFTVYSEGLFYASVCSSLSKADTEDRMSARPSGTAFGWQLSADETFASGRPNPCPCDQKPDTHTHYLFEC